MPDDQSPSDIDPELLLESGRASAIQDLANQAKSMADRASALHNSSRQELVAQAKRWRRTSALLATGILILLVMGGLQFRTSQNNAEILEDVDKLVAFVEERESTDPDPQVEAVFRAVLETRQLICASSDPVQVAQCAELGGEPNE